MMIHLFLKVKSLKKWLFKTLKKKALVKENPTACPHCGNIQSCRINPHLIYPKFLSFEPISFIPYPLFNIN
ncbi:hypothetical protein BpHYR1_026261 [Brachionus plicatilis]|uniref:Transposase n=1 Tax=Brachionus plicatilis TaxID=10195 RepID=A0A3M7PST1_BRAPC|nr:hypothetical protein BpHYR1_026261 [Brachionus plicatilis]